MRRPLLILFVLLGGCDGETTTSTRSGTRTTSPANVIDPDTRPAFVLDASKPFIIELGRGSGMDGLDTIKVNETGAVKLHRILVGDDKVETASLRLSDADVKKLVGLVNSHRLTGMGRSYSNPAIADGTQWVLWIQQPPSEKAVYFNNSFPEQITAFADGLDALLQGAGVNRLTWKAVPRQEGIDQQMALWARIESPKAEKTNGRAR